MKHKSKPIKIACCAWSNVAILASTSDLSIGHDPAKAIEGKSKNIKVRESNFFMSSFLNC